MDMVQYKFSIFRVQPLEDGQINQAQVMPFVLHPHQSNQYLSAIASRYIIIQFHFLISLKLWNTYHYVYAYSNFGLPSYSVGLRK